MSKIVLYVALAVVVVGGLSGGYYYFSRTEVVQVESPQSSLPPTSEPQPKPKPNHGDFEKRFQPTMPPSNGGKMN